MPHSLLSTLYNKAIGEDYRRKFLGRETDGKLKFHAARHMENLGATSKGEGS